MLRSLSRRCAAFGILAAQLLAGGVVGLAHARERWDAPRHIEAAQNEQCLTVHDATGCTFCAVAHTRATAPDARPVAFTLPAPSRTAAALVAARRTPPPARTGDARAPPHTPA